MRHPVSSKILSLTATLTLIGLAACAGAPDAEDDARDDVAVSDGKADAFGYAEGTPDAIGILKVANTVSLADLKDKSKVGITTQAAKGIVAARPYATLMAIDAVPYVGKVTFGKLFAYAQQQGWVPSTPPPAPTPTDPFDPASCAGAAMTEAQALAHFGPGASSTTLGTFTVHSRSRTCNTQTGCAAWSAPTSRGTARLELLTSAGQIVAAYVAGNGAAQTCNQIGNTPDCPPLQLGGATPFTGVLTDHCFRVEANESSVPGAAGNFTATDRVVLVAPIAAGCVATTCAAAGASCGSISDGCGGTLACGACAGQDTCGGGGSANVCGHYVSPCGVCYTGTCCDNHQGGYDCFDEC